MYTKEREKKEIEKISMDDGYSRLLILAGVLLLFLAAGYALWKYVRSRQENVTEEDIMTMVMKDMSREYWNPARLR